MGTVRWWKKTVNLFLILLCVIDGAILFFIIRTGKLAYLFHQLPSDTDIVQKENLQNMVMVAPQSELNTPYVQEDYFGDTLVIITRAKITKVLEPGSLFEVQADNRKETFVVRVEKETTVMDADYALKNQDTVDYYSVNMLSQKELMNVEQGDIVKITFSKESNYANPVNLLSILLMQR